MACEEMIYPLAACYFGREVDKLNAATRFKKDLKADALSFWEFVLLTEERFCCFLEEEKLNEVTTLGQLATLVREAMERGS